MRLERPQDGEATSGNLLVVYGLRQFRLNPTNVDHLYCFERHSAGRCFYINLALRRPPRWLLRVDFDLVIYDTTFLGSRWNPSTFDTRRRRAAPLKGLGRHRVALPQDEFIGSRYLEEFFDEFDVDVVCSVAPESEWTKLYPRLDRSRVRFHRTLTGYLEPARLQRMTQFDNRWSRSVDIGYRAHEGLPYLGTFGMLKSDLADTVRAAAHAHGLTVDISNRRADARLGEDWYRFLAGCKYTCGMEGGASVMDPDGSIKSCVERYVSDHPQADFKEIEAACFPGKDGLLALKALSPRHLEAAATRTCQILVEGEYSGVLKPGMHYIPLRRDMSNLDEVLETVKRDDLRGEITDAAFRDIVASGSYTYDRFVAEVERVACGEPLRASAQGPRLRHRWARLIDRCSWLALHWSGGIIRRARALRRGNSQDVV